MDNFLPEHLIGFSKNELIAIIQDLKWYEFEYWHLKAEEMFRVPAAIMLAGKMIIKWYDLKQEGYTNPQPLIEEKRLKLFANAHGYTFSAIKGAYHRNLKYFDTPEGLKKLDKAAYILIDKQLYPLKNEGMSGPEIFEYFLNR